MKVLFVTSGNKGSIAPFVEEQANSLIRAGIGISFFSIRGRGALGYLANLPRLKRAIRDEGIELVHAHYGLSGLLAGLQRKVPVVTTFLGSDINDRGNRLLSGVAASLSACSVFVSEKQAAIAKPKVRYIIQPYGIDTSVFSPSDRAEARKELGFDLNETLLLFAGAFNNPVKNATLAKQAADRVPGARLLELHQYSRHELSLLMNACNLLLMTSFTEGSPQVVKEALACNCAVVSTDVGDVQERISGLPGCHITTYDPADISEKIMKALGTGRPENARSRILSLGLDEVAQNLREIYTDLLRS